MSFVWASLLLLLNLAAWMLNLVSLPGNWLVLLFAVVYFVLLRDVPTGPHLSWWGIGLAAAFAVLGELWEFFASAAGATKKGGSRRGAVLAIAGSIGGSLVGAFVGVPIPVIGPLIGAVGGGALGAFLGAYAGEGHRTSAERIEISRGAFFGKLWGVMGKLVLGFAMVATLAIDAFLDFSM